MAVENVKSFLDKVLKQRKSNLYDLFWKSKQTVGLKVARKTWNYPQCYYTITRVRILPTGDDNLRRGKAWGTFTWRGQLMYEGREKKVRGSRKREWFILDKESGSSSGVKVQQSEEKKEQQTESA